MPTVYEKHDKAFSNVSAYAIVKDGQLVGKIAYKFPKDGAGRLVCFLHFHGYEMVTGYAGGYGYDKRSASLEAAADHKDLLKVNEYSGLSAMDEFPVIKDLQNIGGSDACTVLRKAGYDLFSII